MFDVLQKYLERHAYIRNHEAEKLGVSRMTLSNLVKSGQLQRQAQGVYSLPGIIRDELVLIAGRSPNIVFSHETALALHQLHNRIPDRPSVTIPQGCNAPRSIGNLVKVYRICRDRHDVGLSTATTFMGNDVPCYDPERTICDVIRSYSRLNIETYANAIRNYVAAPTKNLVRLMEYARRLGIESKVLKTLEVLV